MKRLAFAIGMLAMVGCSSTPTDPTKPIAATATSYPDLVSQWTQRDESYHNFAQTFQVAATLLSRTMIEGQLRLDSEKLNWSSEQLQEARQKALNELESQTTVFLSLYTEKDEDNNLDKTNSVWNLFLDVNGKRLTPVSIKRVYENRAVLLEKYPHINVWSRNYYIKFPISVDEATNSRPTFTIAGALGNARLKFSK